MNPVAPEAAPAALARVALFGLANAIGVISHPVIDWPEAPRLSRHGGA